METVVLVAFGVDVPNGTMKDAQEALMERLIPLLQSRDHSSPVVEWWIAEDERYDRNDLDSAVFIPQELTQQEARELLVIAAAGAGA